VYEKTPTTDRVYGTTIAKNNLIFMNGAYYLCIFNKGLDTLDNGIDIYINKKWKNVFVNIYMNDNTLFGISNTNRDDLYNSLFSNLTAKNFMDAINDMGNKYGFSDFIRYIIIEEDGSYNIHQYNDNLSTLTYLLESQGPDELQIRTNSYKLDGVTPNKNLFKVNQPLINNEILNLNYVNNYNSDKLGAEFTLVREDINIVENASGQRNINYIPIYRFSGDYMPIFQTIELFERVIGENNELIGNYKFDTSLSKFGIMEERIFL